MLSSCVEHQFSTVALSDCELIQSWTDVQVMVISDVHYHWHTWHTSWYALRSNMHKDCKHASNQSHTAGSVPTAAQAYSVPQGSDFLYTNNNVTETSKLHRGMFTSVHDTTQHLLTARQQ